MGVETEIKARTNRNQGDEPNYRQNRFSAALLAAEMRHVLNLTGRPVGGIRNGLANGAKDLPHHRPIFGAQIAGKLLLDRQLDLGADQSGASCKEDAGLIDRRLFHGGATTLGPDRG